MIRRLLHSHVRRRSPWASPWWIHGVSYGVLSSIRQALIMLASAEMSTQVRIASWNSHRVIVVGAVNAVVLVLSRQATRHKTWFEYTSSPTPTWIPLEVAA